MTLFFHAKHLPPDQPRSASTTKLATYNFKSSKPNRLASPFGQRIRKKLSYVQKLLLEASIQPVQWLDPLLIAVLTKIPITAKTSLLAELSPRVATIAPLLPPQHMLLLSLLQLLSLRLLLLAPPTPLWLNTQRINSSRSSEPFWILDFQHQFRPPLLPPPRTLKAHVSGP